MSEQEPVRRLAAEWRSFTKTQLPAGISHEAREALRRAFYFGAMAFCGIVLRDISDSPETTEAEREVFDSLRAELLEFNDDLMKAGHA